jgi:hypothetical protein
MRIPCAMRVLALLMVALLGAAACTPADPPAHAAPLPRWTPGTGQRWQIQLGGTIDQSVNVTYYDLDPVTTPQGTVHAIAAGNHRMICHLDIDVVDEAMPDAVMIPSDVVGTVAGPGLRWLDIRAWARVKSVVRDGFDLCKTKGFQGVDADMADGYAYRTGFDLTAADQRAYDLAVIAMAHDMGLDIAVRTAPDLVAAVEPTANFAVVAGCAQADTCEDYRPYVAHGKVVLDVETLQPAAFCPRTLYYRFAAIGKPDGLASSALTSC